MTASSKAVPPPFLRLGLSVPPTPLVIAVPHGGRYYPGAIEQSRAVAQRTLEGLEDRYADRLIGPTVAEGAVAIVATHARAWIDLNRGREDAGKPDAVAASLRARSGLGLVPSRIGGQNLWRQFPDDADVDARTAAVHLPYHRAIAEALAAAKARHGTALLVDCHSMPPLGRLGRPSAKIVIGDLHGASALPAIVQAAAAACARHGLRADRNVPYAGAFTIQHHARPSEGIYAIQVEIDRSLYLRDGLREPSSHLDAIASIFAELCWDSLNAIGMPQTKAAE